MYTSYDKCPRCRQSKDIRSNICQKCRWLRPEIEQPADAAIRHIPLTQGQIVIVGTDSYDGAMQWLWCAHRRRNGYYAVRTENGREPRTVFLHRWLMGEPHAEVDHINGNTLDCRMQNLRVCTHQQNLGNQRLRSSNSSGYGGVHWDRGKWQVRIRVGDKRLDRGRFDKLEDAIAARVYAELVYLGEFAPAARDLLVLPPNLLVAGQRV